MCGFAGFIQLAGSLNNTSQVLREMGNAIATRGPDDVGCWEDNELGIHFVHRRLAIQDLSSAGHQPMYSNTKRYTIVFNGEIYNHMDIREKIEKDSQAQVVWNGYSDTETILASIELYGLQETLDLCVGMFAIALFDADDEKLFLVRDRFGEKPLYYGTHQNTFMFGSQLSALQQHPDFIKEIEHDALASLLRYSYVRAPLSIYKGISKLEPASLLTYDLNNQTVSVSAYWSFSQQCAAKASVSNTTNVDYNEQLKTKLQKAVNRQMLSDVSLGAFLSGGIDSSLIVSLMQAESDKPIKTFSIGFNDKEFDEAIFAKEVAGYIGTDHEELYVNEQDLLEVIPRLPDIYDEPFADSSQIPTYLVSKLAKSKVTVCLSGDAGDEIFAGYNRYVMTERYCSRLFRFPVPLRKFAGWMLSSISINSWNKLAIIFPGKPGLANLGLKLHKIAKVLSSENVAEVYAKLTQIMDAPEDILLKGQAPGPVSASAIVNHQDGVLSMMEQDLLTYLHDDILTKVDRAAMSVSLETRVPFLDHELVEFAWSIPKDMKIKNGTSKYCLRELLYKYVPKELIERPKRGFAVPLAEWLRGPLKEWAENLLRPELLQEQGFFKEVEVSHMWRAHLAGKKNFEYQLWNILMFQAWYQKNK